MPAGMTRFRLAGPPLESKPQHAEKRYDTQDTSETRW